MLNHVQYLAECTGLGDKDKSAELLSFLLAKAASPYLDMLRR